MNLDIVGSTRNRGNLLLKLLKNWGIQFSAGELQSLEKGAREKLGMQKGIAIGIRNNRNKRELWTLNLK